VKLYRPVVNERTQLALEMCELVYSKPCGMSLQELMKMFNDSDSFYYCENADLTSTIQRRHQQADVGPDDRFFWNKHMLSELVDSPVSHRIIHICR